MPDWRILAAITALGIASYAMRAGGFIAAGAFRGDGLVSRFLRLAPGNLFIAFVAAGCLDGGWPSLIGCASASVTIAATKREWAALAAGFASAASAAALVAG